MFKALRPATNKVPKAGRTVHPSPDFPPFTFSSNHSKTDSDGSFLASPIFIKAQGHALGCSSARIWGYTNNLPIPSWPHWDVGRSIRSTTEQEFGASGSDSDTLHKLQMIFSNSYQEDTYPILWSTARDACRTNVINHKMVIRRT